MTTRQRRIINWLESPEGEAWSRMRHQQPLTNNVYCLVSIKNDLNEELGHEFLWVA